MRNIIQLQINHPNIQLLNRYTEPVFIRKSSLNKGATEIIRILYSSI